MTGRARRRGRRPAGRRAAARSLARLTVATLSALLVAATVADAAVTGAAAVRLPPAMTVGDQARPASLTLVNVNSGPQAGATNTVCNAGDSAPPCVPAERGIVLVPACGQIVASLCAPSRAEPGVFALSATGAGRTGSACEGLVFDIALADPSSGAVRFTPRGAGTRVTLPGTVSFCLVDFTVDVVRMPAIDQDPATDGVQTAQSTEHTQHFGGLSDHVSAFANAVTITRATPAIASSTSPVGTVGVPMRDSAAVSGRVTPVDGATLDFRLFGPDDVGCSGPPAFESLGVPYGPGAGLVESAPFTPTRPGTYRWIAGYSGDANNLAVSGVCGDEGETVLVAPAPPGAPASPTAPDAAGATAGYCFSRRATIVAVPGQKVITGTAGADVIIGGAAGETIDGRGGNDLICAGRGNDTVRGGRGNDKLRGEAGNDRLFGGAGADLLLGSGGADDLRAGSGADRAAGGDGTDRVDGGDGDDRLDEQRLGGNGRDRILGGAGRDVIRTAGGAADIVDCGAGRDRLLRDRADRARRCERVTRA